MIAVLVVVPAAVLSAPTTAGALGPNAIRAGFATTPFPGNDDGSVTVSLPFSVDFFGTTYNQLFLNNNGNVTFDAALAAFTPFDLFNSGRVIIAPFFADVDTRFGTTAAYGSTTVDGHNAWGATWQGVGCFFENTSVLNYFQVVLIDRSDVAANAFDIEFNYDQIQWDSGQASGGDANCLNGGSAHAGYSNGTAAKSFELPGSGVNGGFLDSNSSTGLVNNSFGSAQLGRYVFSVRNGEPIAPTELTTSLSAGTQSGASVSVPPNTQVTDSATLSGANAATATGSVTYSVYSDSSCDSFVADGGTKTVSAGSVPDSDPVSLANPGTYYWQAAYTGDGLNSASISTCGDETETVSSLTTSIVGVPEPVTAGSDVQYTVTVTNNAATAVTGVQVVDTLPAGTTFVSASPGCTGTGPVTCSLGTINGASSKSVAIVVGTPPGSAGSTITDSAVTTPGGSTASFDSHPSAATGDSASGFVPPGGSITTGGNNPSTLSLPAGPGAFVTLDHVFGATFCAGTCTGPATFVNNFTGYTDPHHPIDLKTTLRFPNRLAALHDFQTAKGYKFFDDPTSPLYGTTIVIPDCKDDPTWTRAQKKSAGIRRETRVGTHSGIANPSPCIDGRTVTKRADGVWQTTFEILYLSGDGGFARR